MVLNGGMNKHHDASFEAGIWAGRRAYEAGEVFSSPTAVVDHAKGLAAERGFEPDDFACGFDNEFHGWVA